MSTAYCTVLARNYLPKALALAESLRAAEGADLHVLLIDAEGPDDVADLAAHDIPGVVLHGTDSLELGTTEVQRLVMSYELVEFATAIKPVFFAVLMRDHDAVVYLDPDTFVLSPMDELEPALAGSASGILLTPHFLRPPTPEALAGDGHLLHVGFHNLGFLAIDRRASDFLDWWWGHLRFECLDDPLGGLFVDQRWTDVGAFYFDATTWRHPGYNVGVFNLEERELKASGEELYVDGGALRLFHFHAFDPERPEEITTRVDVGDRLNTDDAALAKLSRHYAERVLHWRSVVGEQPGYRYLTDSLGTRVSRGLRRAYRLESEHTELPSAFAPADRERYRAWRRKARPDRVRGAVDQAMKAGRAAAPDAALGIQRRFPRLIGAIRGRVGTRGGMWI